MPEDEAAEEPKLHGRGGAAHAANASDELRTVLATRAGEEADYCYHLSALREMYLYARDLYDGAGFERAATVTKRLCPAEIAVVNLWARATGTRFDDDWP